MDDIEKDEESYRISLKSSLKSNFLPVFKISSFGSAYLTFVLIIILSLSILNLDAFRIPLDFNNFSI